MDLVKVRSTDSVGRSMLILKFQTSFASAAEGLAAWGLKNYNMTFVRRELRTLVFKYIHRGDAVVEYDT